MADEPATAPAEPWTVDIQRGIAWLIVGIFGAVVSALMARVVFSAEISDVLTVANIVMQALIGITMLIVGFFFGSSKSSQVKDDTQSKMVEKLLPPTPPDAATTVTTTTTQPTTVTTDVQRPAAGADR